MPNFNSVDYWKEVINEIETTAQVATRKEIIKNLDYSLTIPKDLRERVAKILPYEFYEFDRNAYISKGDISIPKSLDLEESSELEERKKKVKKTVFNESTCSVVERLENEYPKFEMKIDTPIIDKSTSEEEVNWFTNYICKDRKSRVIWDSKIYQMERSRWEKSLDEQAEDLMDASAERFTDWVNTLGSHEDNLFTKEKLKALFTIEGDRRLLASIQTEPKEVKAIAQTVANKWNLPEMAIELKYEKYIEDRLKNIPKKVIKVAFGRTVPNTELPWLPSDRDVPITTVFPEELITGQKLFKGIGHLRTTKKLIEFYRKHPSIPKPEYLVNRGMFNRKEVVTTKKDIPLYELLKLKY